MADGGNRRGRSFLRLATAHLVRRFGEFARSTLVIWSTCCVMKCIVCFAVVVCPATIMLVSRGLRSRSVSGVVVSKIVVAEKTGADRPHDPDENRQQHPDCIALFELAESPIHSVQLRTVRNFRIAKIFLIQQLNYSR